MLHFLQFLQQDSNSYFKACGRGFGVGRYRNAHRIFKVSLVVLAIVGFVLTFALIVKADFLAEMSLEIKGILPSCEYCTSYFLYR